MPIKKVVTSKVSFCIPENLDIDLIVDQAEQKANKKFSESKRQRIKSAVYFILNALHELSLQRKYREEYELYGGYPIDSKILKKIIGSDYKSYITLLENANVVDRSDGYQVGEQCKLLSLTKEYISNEIKYREMPKGPIRNRVLKEKAKQDKQLEILHKQYGYILKWQDDLTLDKQGVHNFIEFYGYNLAKNISPADYPISQIKTRINYRVNSLLATVQNVEEKNFRVSKSGKDGRLHTTLTNAKKEFRSLLMYKNQPLISLDIKSSQPFLLSCLSNRQFYQKGEHINIYTLLPEISPLLNRSTIQSLLLNILMWPDSSESQYEQEIQGIKFSDVCWEKDFYTTLMNLANQRKKGKTITRDQVKRQVMFVFFNHKESKRKSTVHKLMEKHFPREAALLDFFKQLTREKKEKNKRCGKKKPTDEVENFLPILLQRLESFLMLDCVCKRISIELANAPIYTIHDCIMTLPEYGPGIIAIMKDEIQKRTGFIPGVKEDHSGEYESATWLKDLALNDIHEILENKSLKSIPDIQKKKPVLYKFPLLADNSKILSTRYIDPNHDLDS